MKKKLLKAIPAPKADEEQIRAIAKAGKDIRGVIVSQKKRIDGLETLVLNVFQVSGRNKKDVSLQFRVFCQKEDYTTLDIDGNKWRTGALLNLVCGDSGYPEYWWNYKQLEFLTEDDSAKTEKTFRKWLKDTFTTVEGRAAFYFLEKYQEHIKTERLKRKHRKITDVIDAEMEKFGEIPADYGAFVEERVFSDENYIFYSMKNKTAYCTSCKKDFVIKGKYLWHKNIPVWNTHDSLRHNSTVVCPYCNKYLKAKSEGMSRSSLLSVQWSVLTEKHGEEVLTRYFRHTKDFRKSYRNPIIDTSERYRTIHSAEKAVDYMYSKFLYTNEVRWCYYNERRYGYIYWQMPSEFVLPRSVMAYNQTFQEVVEGTCMKYSVPDLWFENVVKQTQGLNTAWAIDNYFNSYRKYPFIEQLLKVGFYEITKELLVDYKGRAGEMNIGCNSILGTLGVNKYQFNMLRKLGNPRIRDLDIIKYKPDLKWEEFKELRYIQDSGYVDMYKHYIDFMQYTTLHKLCRYIREQKINHEIDYFDYAGWMEEMGYDMKNEFNLFPRDFKKSHDEMAKQYQRFKDKKAREDTKRFNKMLKQLKKDTADVDAMNLDINGLFIRLPNKLDELTREGEALHHCVGTYIEKVKTGKTMIFFIRQKDEPDKSYYTLEWKGSVVQCRGMRNCDMTPEVKAFVAIFETKMKEYESTPVNKQRKAG